MENDPSNYDPQVPFVIRALQWRVIIPLLLVGILLSFGAAQGRRAFHSWKEHRLALGAAAHLEQGRLREAALSAWNVLAINPNNVEACRIMAEIAHRCGSSESLAWRARIVALKPNDLRARLDWAGEAVARGETTLANEALLGVKPADRTSVEYHEVAAGLAISVRCLSLAHRHLTAALKREPNNPRLRLNLATLELGSTDPAILSHGRTSLVSLAKEPSVRLLALRALLADALQGQDMPRAISIGRELASTPDATFRDKLLHLGTLYRGQSPEAYPRLMELKNAAAAAGSSEVGEMVAWMNANGMAAQSIAWAHTLPTGTTDCMPVPVTLSEAHAFTQDWEGLLQMLNGTQWGEFEPLRVAITSRAFRELGNEIGSQFQWRTAVRLALNQNEMLHALTHFATMWGWRQEAEQILWDLANRPTPPRAVLQALYRHYQAHRDTKGLHRVTARIVQLDPSDHVAMNNLALFSILLNLDLDDAFKRSRDLHETFPNDPVFASTHAFALHRRGRTAEGLKVFESLGPKALRTPVIAVYYGVLLAGSGEKARAREFLDLGAATPLLPPEEALVAEARRKLQ